MRSSFMRAAGMAPCDLTSYAGRAPRYTSYPPATELDAGFGPEQARIELERIRRERPDVPISLYAHIPYCSRLCWYCGCNVTITRDRSRGSRYVDTLIAEVELLSGAVGSRPIAELALGGGSPNFLTPADLERLVSAIAERFGLFTESELGIELDPRDSDRAHLTTLARIGFRRLSVGVQDFDERVQQAINRQQSAAQTAALVEDARGLGFRHINVDLVYGLPLQTPESLARTLDEVLAMDPDQVALFGYAHLPDRLPHQRLVERAGPVPGAAERAELLFLALERFDRAGYLRIGIDHFSRPEAPLARAALEGRLHRNFQGYVPRTAEMLLAVGATGISDSGQAYWQNVAAIEHWRAMIEDAELPVARGVALTRDDQIRRHVIRALMCDAALDLREVERAFAIDAGAYFEAELETLTGGDYERLVEVDREAGWIGATSLGCNLIRNVCMVFDRYSRSRAPGRFSSTI